MQRNRRDHIVSHIKSPLNHLLSPVQFERSGRPHVCSTQSLPILLSVGWHDRIWSHNPGGCRRLQE